MTAIYSLSTKYNESKMNPITSTGGRIVTRYGAKLYIAIEIK